MASFLKKTIDLRHKAIFNIRLDGASQSETIDPELLYGAYIKITASGGGFNTFTEGEDVSQATSGATAKVFKILSDTVAYFSTNRDTAGAFDATNIITETSSGSTATATAKEIVSPLRLSLVKMSWGNLLGTAADGVVVAWDATIDQNIIKVGNGSGKFELPGSSIEAGTIAGQTGGIVVSSSTGFVGANDFASLLIEVHKSGPGFVYARQ